MTQWEIVDSKQRALHKGGGGHEDERDRFGKAKLTMLLKMRAEYDANGE